jgi:hypothetical protein
VKNDFGLSLSNDLPPLGSVSRGLRVISESWNEARTQLTVELSGLPGRQYELDAWNSSQVSSVDGAALTQGALNQGAMNRGKIHVDFPAAGSDEYQHRSIVFHFAKP